MRAYAGQVREELCTAMTDLAVSFMDTADVTIVVTFFANFQIQIVLHL